MSDTVQAVKDRLSIVDVVAPYVKLAKAGKYWKGLSPFTKEKTPSFFVSPDRGLYHCFSTGKGGDMFTFVEEMERVDFRGALKILAEKAGVPLSYEPGTSKDRKDALYAAMEVARDYFVAELQKHPAAVAYLSGRGITKATSEAWGLGYAPKSWQGLHEHLAKQGITDVTMEEAGLIKRQELEAGSLKVEEISSSKLQASTSAASARLYDRFRGRIMFPIRDASGRVIAFTGRIFEDDPAHPQAKYLNSPETALFEKSKVLYGIDVAKTGIRHLNCAILVEGQVDLLMAHQAGYQNTLALSGTAFTEDHARLIMRHTENFVIAFDGDRAGVAAAGRAASIALAAGLNTKVAAMPAGEDPADLIKRDTAAWKQAIREASHVIDFYLGYIEDSGYDERRKGLEISRTVLPYVAAVKNEIDRAHFVKRIAESANIPEEAVRAELKKVAGGSLKREAAPSSKLQAPSWSSEPFLSRGASLERLIAGITAVVDDDHSGLAALSQDEARAAMIEADLFLEQYPTEDERKEARASVTEDYQREQRREEYRKAVAKLKAAERAGDGALTSSLMTELTALAKTL